MSDGKIEITWAEPGTLKANSWNTNIVSPENERKIDASLDRFGDDFAGGMFKPILVRELEDGSLEILGGEHRAERAAKKGISSVPVINLGRISDKKAKEIGLVDNGRYGIDDTLSLSELLKGLGDFDDIASYLPYSDAELNAIFSSVQIDLGELDDLDDEEPLMPETPASRPVQTHQIMRFKVPVDDAHKITDLIEKTIKEQGFDDSDSLTNAGDALVHLVTQMS